MLYIHYKCIKIGSTVVFWLVSFNMWSIFIINFIDVHIYFCFQIPEPVKNIGLPPLSLVSNVCIFLIFHLDSIWISKSKIINHKFFKSSFGDSVIHYIAEVKEAWLFKGLSLRHYENAYFLLPLQSLLSAKKFSRHTIRTWSYNTVRYNVGESATEW